MVSLDLTLHVLINQNLSPDCQRLRRDSSLCLVKQTRLVMVSVVHHKKIDITQKQKEQEVFHNPPSSSWVVNHQGWVAG